MAIYALDGRSPVLAPDSWIAPSASVIGNVELKTGASVWFGATVRGDRDPIVVGEDTNIQDGLVLHTDDGEPLTVGRGVTVGHMVMLHGCTIGDHSLIGIGSVLLNGVVIGNNCIVGARTLLTEGKVIPDNSLVVGSPGKVVRQVTPEEARFLAWSAAHYVENWKRYQAGLQAL